MGLPNIIDPSEFVPDLDKPFDVTLLFEKRNLSHAVNAILRTLNEYHAGFCNAENPSVALRANGSYWICVGDVSLSSYLKDGIRRNFRVAPGDGEILFKNWEQMKADFPEIINARRHDGKAPAFVGFPLPQED